MNNKEYNEAIRLIDRLYRDLYKSDIVLHGNKNEFQKIERLEKVHKKVIGFVKRYVNKFSSNKYLSNSNFRSS